MLTAESLATRSAVTRRECAIVQHMIALHTDRAALKSKLESEKAKAMSANHYDEIHACLRALIKRAEAGRDLGPAE